MSEYVPFLRSMLMQLHDAKEAIVERWVGFEEPRMILHGHGIDAETFREHYAGNVFDYFLSVIEGEQEIGDCPVMAELLSFLKDKEISADELFIICSHFRKAMLDFSYEHNINSKELFDEVSSLFDRNFAGVLKRYTDTIYQKERELEKSVKLLSEYRKAMDESALVSKTDVNGVITYVNDNFIEASGFSRDELIGRTHRLIRHDDMPSSFYGKLWSTIKNKLMFKGTIKNLRKNGEYFYLDTTIVPVMDPMNNITEYMAIGYEVTKLIDARQTALEAGQAKDYFLSNMSHEIRTPLNAVLGFVALLQDEVVTPQHQKYLEIIHNSGENLLSIINDILDFSKLRSGEFTVEPRPFSIHEELSHTLELFVPSANKKSIAIYSFIDPKIPCELVADPLRIKQIISNFLSNAIKFTPVGGTINVEGSFKEGVLSVNVTDTGAGISPADQSKIFDAFSQAHTHSERLSGGTGLGLSICRQLAEHMQGHVGVVSELGKGSCFTLSVPVNVHGGGLQMFDATAFESLKLAVLQRSSQSAEKLDSLNRYWQVFNMRFEPVSDVEAEAYDLLFFVDSTVDDKLRRRIEASGRPAIAIMDCFDDKYDDAENITPLCFPIYCSKLYQVFSEALKLNNPLPGNDRSLLQRKFNGRVLVAEDNPENQELVRIILERYGLEAVMTHNGKEAVEVFMKEPFDLILMDEQMPVKNGIEATREILEYENLHNKMHTPIIAVTANVIKKAHNAGWRAGYDGFLGKPISIKQLEKVFEQFLSEKAPVVSGLCASKSHAVEQIGGLDIELLKQELMLEHEQIVMLLQLYKEKMAQTLSELSEAIIAHDYEGIARKAHAIKGSSANFRLDDIQLLAAELEEAAKANDRSFDYDGNYQQIKSCTEAITL